ncbi:hypothetical protein KUTeg_016632 [Tegillarca granosa]|uniref:Uncharacterized protein n=1 Tax=Tegillarca granosa TaxID=220873 RepID=A0ABQ9ER74_TEGGR|nr:hypothetical protein KUTeg_016632 [Tegillarca granosa]
MLLRVAMVTVIFSLYVCETKAEEQDQVYTQCGGKVDGDHGVIQTPYFPIPFPTPIYCKWIISAPHDRKIIVYMTQFYLRDSLDVYEYDNYEEMSSNSLGHKLTSVNYTTSYIVSYKPFLVLRFAVHDLDKIHRWVLDYVVDVFGFNITYKLAGLNDEVENGCSVFYCSYLGNCYASSNYSTFKCHCFEGYFGEMCQYGPYCDPPRANLCLNGGTCRYFSGSQELNCVCPEGYSGRGCKYPPLSIRHANCISLGCSQRCETVEDTFGNETCRGRTFTEHNKTICGYCTCDEAYRLADDDKSCLHIDKYRVTVTVFPTTNSSLKFPKMENITLTDLERSYI